MADTIKTNLGPVTAYADAKAHGYTGTREEFGQLLAGAGQNLADAVSAKEAAESAAGAAGTSAQTAAGAANTACQAAGTAANAAEDARTSAGAAAQSAEAAETAKQSAEDAAKRALEAKTGADNALKDAGTAKEAASNYADAAADSATAAATSETNAANSASAAAGSAAAAAQTKAEVGTLGDEKKQALQDEGTAQQAAIEKKGQDTLATIPENYTQTVQAVSRLKEDTTALQKRQNVLVGSESGNPVSCDDAFAAPLCGLNVYGKSTQDGTPTPDAPVPIVSTGDGGTIAVKMTGKNLLYIPDGEATAIGVTITSKNGIISISGTATEDGYVYLPVKQISIHGLAFSSSNVSGATVKLVSASWNVLFTQGRADNTQEVITRICFVVKTGTNYDLNGINVQLELGSTATAYSPYREQLLTLSTPNGLPGIPVTSGGNYTDPQGQQWICDEVDLERGIYKKRVSTTVLTVDMVQSLSQSVNDYCIMIIPPIDYKYTHNIRIALMSNRFIYDKKDKNKGIIFGYGSQIRLYVDKNEIATLAAAKEFIEKNQIEIMYEVNEPTETPLTPAELAAYKALAAYAPNTVVQASDGAGIKLDYQRDVNLVIKNLEDAIASMTTT